MDIGFSLSLMICNIKLNKIRDLFKVKLYTIRYETKKKGEQERERVREREKERDFK